MLKVMILIFRSPLSLPAVAAISPRISFTTACFYDNIFPKSVERMPFNVSPTIDAACGRRHPDRESIKCLKRF
jgi:hypothetical protein